MNEKDEASSLSLFYVDKLIQIADKYGVEREKFCKLCVMALIPTIDMINFKTYTSGKERE